MGYYEDEDLRGGLCDSRIAIITCASISLATDVLFLSYRLAWMTTPRPLRRMRLKDRRFSLEGRYSSSEPRILLSSDTYIINNHLGALWCEAVNAELFFDGR